MVTESVMKNFKVSLLKWGGRVKKLLMLALANIRKTKSASITLVVMFIIASSLMNIGLLVVINYGNFFNTLKDELYQQMFTI